MSLRSFFHDARKANRVSEQEALAFLDRQNSQQSRADSVNAARESERSLAARRYNTLEGVGTGILASAIVPIGATVVAGRLDNLGNVIRGVQSRVVEGELDDLVLESRDAFVNSDHPIFKTPEAKLAVFEDLLTDKLKKRGLDVGSVPNRTPGSLNPNGVFDPRDVGIGVIPPQKNLQPNLFRNVDTFRRISQQKGLNRKVVNQDLFAAVTETVSDLADSKLDRNVLQQISAIPDKTERTTAFNRARMDLIKDTPTGLVLRERLYTKLYDPKTNRLNFLEKLISPLGNLAEDMWMPRKYLAGFSLAGTAAAAGLGTAVGSALLENKRRRREIEDPTIVLEEIKNFDQLQSQTQINNMMDVLKKRKQRVWDPADTKALDKDKTIAWTNSILSMWNSADRRAAEAVASREM